MLLLVLVFLFLSHTLHCADPDPVLDFCIETHQTHSSCKKDVTGADFASQLLRNVQNNQPPNGFAATLVNKSLFSGLNTMGLSLARADLGVSGVVPLHIHPRSSELVYIQTGTVEAGFIDSNNTLFARTLQQGDMLIVPRGLVHYQYNVGQEGATIIACFNSEDPGVVILGPNLFGSDLPDAVIAASLGMDTAAIEALKKKFKG